MPPFPCIKNAIFSSINVLSVFLFSLKSKTNHLNFSNLVQTIKHLDCYHNVLTDLFSPHQVYYSEDTKKKILIPNRSVHLSNVKYIDGTVNKLTTNTSK